jgi:hypothetical protein
MRLVTESRSNQWNGLRVMISRSFAVHLPYEMLFRNKGNTRFHDIDTFRLCLGTWDFVYVDKLWVGRDSSVGIATAYRLDGPGIESRSVRDFPHVSRPARRPTQPPVQWVPGLSRGWARLGRDADPSPSSSAEVKYKVELYLRAFVAYEMVNPTCR